MVKKFYKPTRMCISCRQQDTQNNLLRFRCIDGELSSFDGVGRSFYLCYVCLSDEKKIAKALMRQCRSGKKDELLNKLKEMITNE
ncbi:MAG: DUF448 domain-containing protein [Epsilonproteobacteria bacterium]|nr:DUF448 domain-containing protein [Campylobacterota bacterium]